MTTRAVELLRRAVTCDDDRSDAQLLDDFVRRRDPAAVEAIVRRHGPMVWGVCRRALPHHDAEDAFQATFLVLARRPDAVRPPGLLGNWLYGVARRTALKAKARAAKRQTREATVDTLPDPPAPEPAAWADLRPVLDRELERLPAKYRGPIVLCDLEGKTRQEAARRLGWPEGTVNSRLSIGRKKLAARLARRGLALSGGVLTVTLVEQAVGRVPPDLLSATVQLLIDPAAPPGPAAVLAHQVVKAMTLNKLIFPALLLAVTGILGGGAFLRPAAGEARPEKPAVTVTADDKPMVLRGHTDSVFALAFSPYGKVLASGSFDKTIKLWDVATGKEIRTLSGHTKQVVSLAFSPDGKRLASAASPFFGDPGQEPGEVKTWDVSNGLELRALEGHDTPIYAVTFSADGKHLVAVGGIDSQGYTTIWDAKTGNKRDSTQGPAVFYGGSLSPDGKWIAVGGADKRVRVRLATQDSSDRFATATHPDPIYAVAYSPDGKLIASAGPGKPPGIRFWDADTGERRLMIETPQRTIKSLSFRPDGKLIAAGAFDGTARVFDVASGKEVLALTDFHCNVNAVAFHPAGNRLAVATEDKLVRVYTLKEPKEPAPVKGEPKEKGEARELDARQTAEAFFRAAVAGEARAHADPQKVSAKKVGEIRQIGLKRVDISTVLAAETEALVVSEPVEVPKEGKGHLLLDVRKKDGRWRVRDIDFRTAEDALARQRDFLEGHPDARPIRAKK
jgi:RNA polymerase sigma factor (sigma-70 family)